MAQPPYVLEFVGGPFDGHRQLVSLPPDELADMVALPVSENVFDLMHGKVPGPRAPVTSIAIYRLDRSEDGMRHWFLRSTAPVISTQGAAWPAS